MGFKLPDSYLEKLKEIEEKKYIDYDGKRIHVSELEDRSVTPEMRDKMRMNSYAQDDLPPKLTTETLIQTVKHYKDNCTKIVRTPCTTYDEALIHNLVPEMIIRLEELQKENNRYHEINKGLLEKNIELQS